MKNSKEVFIITCGILILCIFVGIITFNLMPNNERSSSYYVKVNDNVDAKIDSLKIENNMLTINSTGATEYCVKMTKSTPTKDSICWKKIEGNVSTINVYRFKKYYVWVKDNNGNISDIISINS